MTTDQKRNAWQIEIDRWTLIRDAHKEKLQWMEDMPFEWGTDKRLREERAVSKARLALAEKILKLLESYVE